MIQLIAKPYLCNDFLKMKGFNIRVYGILVNEAQQVLISDEREYGMEFTKFPGGGLEYGEGLLDGLQREFMEECRLPIEIIRHVHTTDRFFKSAFNDTQVIGVYYLVRNKAALTFRTVDTPFDFASDLEPNQVFRWVSLSELDENQLTFDMDRAAWRVFLQTQ